MTLYTIPQAKRNLAALLEEARQGRSVQIQDSEGQLYMLRPQRRGASPLDVEGVDLGVSIGELLVAARSSAEDA
jgi:antitoxin (DNA-binding transcriptional repressor) of toxin-antitoxin stability system